jgi:hypothetical protein
VFRGTISIVSSLKYLMAAISWNAPYPPWIAIRFGFGFVLVIVSIIKYCQKKSPGTAGLFCIISFQYNSPSGYFTKEKVKEEAICIEYSHYRLIGANIVILFKI